MGFTQIVLLTTLFDAVKTSSIGAYGKVILRDVL